MTHSENDYLKQESKPKSREKTMTDKHSHYLATRSSNLSDYKVKKEVEHSAHSKCEDWIVLIAS